MANNAVSPSRIINYISQRKKLIVGRNNQPNQQLIKFDYKLTDTYNFQVINQINQIVAIPSGTTFELYGSFIDGKQQQHLLFYTSGVTADEEDVLTFVVDSYTSEYLNQVKVQKEIDLSIVATDEQGNKSMTLRDKAIAYPRPYVEGRVPTQIVQEIIYVYNQPVTGSFSAGSDINLAPDVDSYAFGEGLYTDTQNQLVIGSWNVPSSTTNQAFVIGNGDNDSNRSNAFSVDWDGNVQAGAISATEIYINGLPVGADTDAKIEVLSTAIDDLSASVPTKVSDLENDAGYLTSSDIPSDYVTNTQLDEAISSFITIEDVPVYTADNKTIQLNGTEFSIKSLESKISGGVGINVTTTDDVTWITYIGGSSTGGKTYLNGTGLGLSTVSAEDGIYKLYVNEEWLTGKIEAQTSGSFDDISISIDNVSGIVDSNYETLTGQTNYLSGQIDTSNEAIGAVSDRVQIIENDYTTSGTVTGWINDLATGAVKTNSDSIDYLSGQISANTASIGELNTSKADLSDFQELTGVVDGINTNLTSNYYTKTEIDTATGAIDERVTAIENDYTTSAQVSGIVTGYNYITSSEIPTQVSVFENDALYVTSSQLTGELNDYTKTTDLNDYLSSGILTGYITDQQLEEKQYATTGIVDAASSAILNTLTGDYALKTDIPTNDEITGLAKDYVDTLNIDTTYATKSEIDDFATSAEVGTIIGDTVTSGYVHDLGFITNAEVEPGTVYSTGFGLAASGNALNTFYLTGTVLSGSEHISIENNVVSLIGEVGKTYNGTANGGVEVDNTNNTITISSNFLSSDALDSYGDKTWVETNFLSTSYSTTIEGNSQAIEDIQGVTGTFALKADIPADIDDFATSAEVSDIVEGLSTAIRTGLALTSDIPTTVAELTDSGDYALKSEIIDTEDVSGVVEDMSGAIINGLASVSDIPTDNEITGLAKDYVDTLNLATTYAQLSDIPTGLDDWNENTNKDYISGLGFITLQQVPPGSVYSTSFGLAASGDSNNIFYLTAGVADLNGYDTLALKTDIPTSSEITGLASAYVDSLDLAGNYASATEFNSVCTALSDAIGLKANSNDVYTKTEADEAFLSSNTFIPVSASQLSGYDDLALKTDLADYITGITFIDGDNNQFASNIFYVSDDLVLTVDEEDENKITLGINGSLAHLEDIPTEATITGYAYNVTTGTVTSSYLTGLGMATTGQIPTKTSDLTNDSEFATTGYVTGYCSAYITSADVLTTLTKVSQLQNDVGYITSSALDDYALTSDIKTYTGGNNIEVTTGNIINFTGTIPSVNGLISASEASEIASAVTTGYLTGYYDKTSANATFAVKSVETDVDTLKAASGDFSNYYTKDQVVPSTSAAMYNAISGDVDDLITSKNYLTSITSSDITTALGFTPVSTDTTYTAGTGLKLTGTEFSLSAAGANEDKVLSSHNGTISWQTNVAGTDIDTVCGMLSSANENLTISKTDNKILFTATGGGTTYTPGDGIDISEQDVISIDQDWLNSHFSPTISNKKNIIIDSEVKDSSFQLVYNANKDIFVNTIESVDGVITINQVSGFVGDNGQVACFEHWIKADGTLTGFVGDGVELVNVPASGLDATKTQVFTRRIVKVNDVVSQYAVWEYQFSNAAVPTTDKIIVVTPQAFTFNLSSDTTASIAYTFTGENQQSVGFTYSGSLPAGISFSNGVFSNTGSQMASNDTAIVPVTISALNAQSETITKIVYCNLTLTGFELVEVPNQQFDFTYNTNATSGVQYTYHGNQSNTVGVVLTGSYSLPAGVSFNNGTFTCVGANLTGNTTTPLTAVISGADVESITTEFDLTIADVPIIASNQTFDFDFRLQDQTSALVYTHLGSATVNVSNANLPNGISYENGYFTATSAANVINGTTAATTTISADDADSAIITTTFNLIGAVTETITAPTSSLVMDFINDDNEISATYQFTYSGSNTVSAEVSGLPNGITWTISGDTITFVGQKSSLNNQTLTATIKLYAIDTAYVNTTVEISVQNAKIDYSTMPMTMVGVDESNSVIFKSIGSPSAITLKYSKNGGAWTDFSIDQTITFSAGETVALSGTSFNYDTYQNNYYQLSTAGLIDLQGNVMSLLNFSNTVTPYCFFNMFNTQGAAIRDISNLVLPATTLAQGCYLRMFRRCSRITTAPQLPATTLVNRCYFGMFDMCSNLSSINVNFTEWVNYATSDWVQGVKSTGTFTCPAGLNTTTRDISHVPTGWTVVTK